MEKIAEIGIRVKALREIMGFTSSEMAVVAEVSEGDYLLLEKGESDFSISRLFRIAEKLDVDMITLLTGESPHLSNYSIVRGGQGLTVNRREGFSYNHLAANFKNKFCEPFLVNAPYSQDEQNKKISMSRHPGQEFNYIISGSLKIQLENHIEILSASDSIIYDSSKAHGMIAAEGKDCTFLAIILK